MNTTVKTEYKITTPDGTKRVSGYVLSFEPALAIRFYEGKWQVDHIPTGYRIFVFKKSFMPNITSTIGHRKKADVLRMLRAASVIPVPWHLITVENVGEYTELTTQWFTALWEAGA